MPFTVLALVGATLLLVRGSLFEPARDRMKLFRCPLCLGFWIGLLGGVARGERDPVTLVFLGCVVSVCALATHLTLNRLEV